jgi:hypothetical protein
MSARSLLYENRAQEEPRKAVQLIRHRISMTSNPAPVHSTFGQRHASLLRIKHSHAVHSPRDDVSDVT